MIRPLASMRKSWSRHDTLRPQKLPINTANDKRSRSGNNHRPLIGSRNVQAIDKADTQRSTQDIARNMSEVKLNPQTSVPSKAIATA